MINNNRKDERKLDYLRKKIEKYLWQNPRINNYHIEKELLEELLFSVNYVLGYDSSFWGHADFRIPGYEDIFALQVAFNLHDEEALKKHGILAKFPVWTGTFLRQIDLSEVDFSHVVWNPEIMDNFGLFWAYDMNTIKYYSTVIPSYENELNERFPAVDLSHTNAVIDFSKSFDSFLFRTQNSLWNVNLNGVDLTHAHTDLLTSIRGCKLVGTNFMINPKGFYASDSDLSGIDLSSYISYYTAYDTLSVSYPFNFEHCLVANSGLTIEVKMQKKPDEHMQLFAEDLDKGFYKGCCIRFYGYDLHSKNEEDRGFPFQLK